MWNNVLFTPLNTIVFIILTGNTLPPHYFKAARYLTKTKKNRGQAKKKKPYQVKFLTRFRVENLFTHSPCKVIYY